jgi:subtilase family serine protease
MQKRTAVRLATSAVAVSALVLGCLAADPGAAGAAPAREAVPHSKPSWLSHANHLGAATQSAPVRLRVYLAPNGGLDAVKSAVKAASTPSSPQYRHFLSPAAYQARFAPRASTVKDVTSWLTAAGLTVTGVEAHNRYVGVTGTVAAAQKAFAVSLQRYRHDGQSVTAPSGTASVPNGVATAVLSVSGLDSTVRRVSHTAKKADPPPAGFVNARPCSLSYGQIQAKYQGDYHTSLPKFNGKVIPYAPCGYTGPQFRAAYEGDSNLNGAGVTVAITDAYAAPTMTNDTKTYAANHGDAGYAHGQLTQSLPGGFTHQAECGSSGWYTEETLDVEAVHAMAGGANIKYYASPSCYNADFIDTLAKVVDDNQAQLVSNSWGGVEGDDSVDDIVACEQVFLQGALQGISFIYSSGDNGDELANTGIKQADYPASDPFVTAVGGTSTAIGPDGSLAWQTGWGTAKYNLSADGTSWSPAGFQYGAGGGYSSLFDRPDYQNGVVSTSALPGRAVPDVALDADPTTGMLLGETQTFPDGVRYGEFRLGGTSLASPLFAGMTALTLQNAGGPVGLLNPTIYAQAGGGSFTDVKGTPKDAGNVRADYANSVDPSGGIRYSVRTFDQDSSLVVTPGWDDVTGLGSPNAGWLTSVSPL